jgi:polyisoprenoid-binding protein YceI
MRRWILGAAGALAFLIAAVLVVSYLRGRDTPPAPELPAKEAGPTGPLRGTLEPAAGSFVGYRVKETLIAIGLNTAVGRTGAVKGSARIEGGRIVAARFEIATGTIRSDEARRDDTMRFRGLETDTYPTAAFALTAPATIAPRFTARGRLTLHGRTRPIAIRLRSARAGSGIDLVGSAPILFSDYGMQPPSVAGVASVRDHGRMEVRLLLR